MCQYSGMVSDEYAKQNFLIRSEQSIILVSPHRQAARDAAACFLRRPEAIRVNLQQLKVFRETIRCKFNVTEAANAVFASQSGISLLIGRALTGEMGFITHSIGIAGAVALGFASYFLEPYRRILLGVFGGLLLGLSLSVVFGFEGHILGLVLPIIGAVIGGFVVPRFFDMFVVVASASSGAAMIVSGLHLLFPAMGLLDGTGGFLLGRLLTVILGVIGIVWQFNNIARWTSSQQQPS